MGREQILAGEGGRAGSMEEADLLSRLPGPSNIPVALHVILHADYSAPEGIMDWPRSAFMARTSAGWSPAHELCTLCKPWMAGVVKDCILPDPGILALGYARDAEGNWSMDLPLGTSSPRVISSPMRLLLLVVTDTRWFTGDPDVLSSPYDQHKTICQVQLEMGWKPLTDVEKAMCVLLCT